MIASLGRPSPMLRRAIAILLALVLALLLLAPNAGACGMAHQPTTGAVAAAVMDHGAPGPSSDCHNAGAPAEPTRPDCGGSGESGCPSSHAGLCGAMAGCSAVVFIVSDAPGSQVAQAAIVTTTVVQHALSRATLPDLPPPRA